MVTLILGKTLAFWSGIAAGTSFFAGLFIRSFINRLKSIEIERKRKTNRLLFILTIILVIIHISLGLLSSLFNIWL